MHIIVDDRESRSEVVEFLRKLDDTNIVFQRLAVGDYLIDNRILCERKTVRDFAISLLDGRLFEQANRLSSSPYQPVCMLEGTTTDLKKLNMSRESIQGAIISLTLLFGIPLLRAFNEEETARLLLYTSTQIQRVAKGTVQRAGYRPKGKRKRQLYILQGLPGVGPLRAEQLLNIFGSVQSVFCASPQELSRVPGFGKKTAEKIHTIVK